MFCRFLNEQATVDETAPLRQKHVSRQEVPPFPNILASFHVGTVCVCVYAVQCVNVASDVPPHSSASLYGMW